MSNTFLIIHSRIQLLSCIIEPMIRLPNIFNLKFGFLYFQALSVYRYHGLKKN